MIIVTSLLPKRGFQAGNPVSPRLDKNNSHSPIPIPVPLVNLPSPDAISPFVFSTCLRNCPHKDADWFLQGLCKGFFIGFDSDRLISAKRNLPSVCENPDIIDSYLKDGISYMSVAGLFDTKPFSELISTMLA